MDLSMILTSLTATATISVIYGFLQNFKAEIKVDINNHISRLEIRMGRLETKISKLEERFDSKMIKLEERRFWLATDKKLEDEILEERIKSSKNV